MLPSTKTFSDILDIDISQALEVILELKEHGKISYTVHVDGVLLDGVGGRYVHKMNLLESIVVDIDVNSIGPAGALEIQLVQIAGVEVIPKYQHLARPRTNYVTTLGRWTLVAKQPVLVWLHEIRGQGFIA